MELSQWKNLKRRLRLKENLNLVSNTYSRKKYFPPLRQSILRLILAKSSLLIIRYILEDLNMLMRSYV